MLPEEEKQAIIDNEHLRILGISFYVMGGLILFYSLIILAYGGLILSIAGGAPELLDLDAADRDVLEVLGVVGWIVVVVLALVVGAGVANIMVGRSLQKRRNLLLCQIVAALNCLSIPFGTLLGVFTLMVLGRESVKSQFEYSE